jgi:hypothetical protein
MGWTRTCPWDPAGGKGGKLVIPSPPLSLGHLKELKLKKGRKYTQYYKFTKLDNIKRLQFKMASKFSGRPGLKLGISPG